MYSRTVPRASVLTFARVPGRSCAASVALRTEAEKTPVANTIKDAIRMLVLADIYYSWFKGPRGATYLAQNLVTANRDDREAYGRVKSFLKGSYKYAQCSSSSM